MANKKLRSAVNLGRRGGKARSAAKTASSRANGLLGGTQPKGAPTGTYRDIAVWQNTQGRWWARRQDGQFGARRTYLTLEALMAALDATLDPPPPVCEVCGEPRPELKTLANGMHAHLACLLELRRTTLAQAGLQR